VGPGYAIPAALAQAGLSTDDIDLYEINEAFASQASWSIAKLGLDEAKVNVNGGAIALGHPLGATGTRCTATLLHEMRRRGSAARFGVVSMCIGSGMGAAAVFERGSEADGLANASAVAGQNHLSRDARV
jgi:acetyl-CoA acyltransferase 1